MSKFFTDEQQKDLDLVIERLRKYRNVSVNQNFGFEETEYFDVAIVVKGGYTLCMLRIDSPEGAETMIDQLHFLSYFLQMEEESKQ